MSTPATQLGSAPAPAGRGLPRADQAPTRRTRTETRLTRIVTAQRDIACADPDPHRIYELAVEAVRAIVGSEAAAAAELVGEELVFRASEGAVGPTVGMRLPMDTSYTGLALRTGRCVLVADSLLDERGDQELAHRLSVRSAVLVPLIHDGVPVAVLGASSSKPNAFSDLDADLLMLMADVTAARLAHALALHDRDTARHSLEAGLRLRATLFDAIGDGIVVQDAAGQIVMANPAAERILGVTTDQMQGRTNIDPRWRTVWPDGSPLPGEDLPASQALRTGRTVRGELVGVHTPDGQLRWLSVTAVPMFDGTPPEVIGVVVSFTDVTADRAAADALRASEQQFRLAFDNAPIGMLVLSLRDGEIGRTLQVNDAFCRMLGYTDDSDADIDTVLSLSLSAWTYAEDVERDELVLRRLAAGDTDRVSFEKRYVNRHGETIHAWVEGAVAHGSDGEPLYVIVHCLDVSERKQAQEELRRLALTDTLTGLANRTLLDDRMRLALARLRRTPGYVALLLIDLDRFKVVNDSLGHEQGDALLAEVARRLVAVTRAGTTVARLGGDEFVVFLDGIATAEEAEVVARRLLATLRAPYALPGSTEPMVTTASLGIAVTADSRRSAADLLREADLALYRAKDAGRDRAALFDDELKTRVVARLDAEHRLRRAIDTGRLVAVYQPLIGLQDGRVCGVEALVRIDDPDAGMLVPAAFIDVAEDTGLIVDIDAWVVGEAVAQLAAWRDSGLEVGHVAVNVSVRSLEELRFVDVLRTALDVHGLTGRRVHVELTERSFLDDSAGAHRALTSLHDIGVEVGIDDFGTGYSALAYLQRFDLDFMKIDRSFVARLGTSVRDDAVVAAIVDLAHAHELRVVAEGVEEPGQLARLRSMGCDTAQGYLMGRPMRADDLAVLVRAGHTW